MPYSQQSEARLLCAHVSVSFFGPRLVRNLYTFTLSSLNSGLFQYFLSPLYKLLKSQSTLLGNSREHQRLHLCLPCVRATLNVYVSTPHLTGPQSLFNICSTIVIWKPRMVVPAVGTHWFYLPLALTHDQYNSCIWNSYALLAMLSNVPML